MRVAIAILITGIGFVAMERSAQTLVIPIELQMPGTQPNEVNNLGVPSQCDNCHSGYNAAVEPIRALVADGRLGADLGGCARRRMRHLPQAGEPG